MTSGALTSRRSNATLVSLADVDRIIDTRTLSVHDEYLVRNAAVPTGHGTVLTYHVTDNPQQVLARIRARRDLFRSYTTGGPRAAELGHGLYGSTVPQLWMGRAGGKWSFLERIDREQSIRLALHLFDEIAEQRATHYITEGEAEYAARLIRHVTVHGDRPGVLVQLAGQPYNITFWKPAYLEQLGIEPGAQPQIVELEVEGLFAEINRGHADPATLRYLRRHGLQGAYMRSGWSTDPQMAVWDVHAIKHAQEAGQ